MISKTVSKTTITPTSDQLKSRLKSEPFPSVTWKKISDFTLDLLHVLRRRQCCPKRGSISAILVICPASFGRRNRTSSNWWVPIFPELTAFLVCPSLPHHLLGSNFSINFNEIIPAFFSPWPGRLRSSRHAKVAPTKRAGSATAQLSNIWKIAKDHVGDCSLSFFLSVFSTTLGLGQGKSEKGWRKNVELIKKDLSPLFYGRMKVEKIIKKFSHLILGPRATMGGWIGWKWSTVRWCLREISSFSKNPWGCWSGLGATETDTETCTGFFH